MTESKNIMVSQLANDPDLLELVELFVNELPQRIAAIERGLSEENIEVVSRLAHQLKGAAGGYGFPLITDAARDLEDAARTQTSLESLRQCVDSLADLCRRARAH